MGSNPIFSCLMYTQVNFNKLSYFLINPEKHPFHLVAPSYWPFCLSFILLKLIIVFFYSIEKGSYYFCVYDKHLWIYLLLYVIFSWFDDIVDEATYQGHHTFKVQQGIRLGFLLFVLSEVMFFFSFFWAFFHYSLCPSIWIGGVWPPVGIKTIDWSNFPLWNTLILISSGFTLSVTHRSLVLGERVHGQYFLLFTILYGILFTLVQLYEYKYSVPFNINDSVYGSIFFLLTGFHGFHVIIGTIFLFVCSIRYYYKHFLKAHHVGFECALIYWHFVDVVWLFLFLVVYIWGSI